MNLTETRQDLVDALSSVDEVTGYMKRPATARPGDAWVRLAGMEATGYAGLFTVTWVAVVLLPADEGAAIEQLETLVPDLDDALRPVAHVQGYAPVSLTGGSGGEQPALEITMTRE